MRKASDGRSRRQKTRDRIAEAAVGLFLRQGVDATTMEEIASAADVVRGTLYNHFPVKEAILVHWLHGQLEAALEPLMALALAQPDVRSRLGTLLEASAQWWQQHRAFAAPYVRHRFQEVREDQGEEPSSAMIPAYEKLIRQGQASGELSDAIPADRLASYLHFLSLCALLEWVACAQAPLHGRYQEALAFFLEGARIRSSR